MNPFNRYYLLYGSQYAVPGCYSKPEFEVQV